LFLDEEMEHWAKVASDLERAAAVDSGEGQSIDVTPLGHAFFGAMDNDLDTPTAIETLRQISTAILGGPEGANVASAQATLRELGDILGLTFCTRRS
jgi:cysteinyl-tRNA synthetase